MATTIYQKLAQVQAKLFVPKGQRNTHGNYNYRSCEDILVAVKPLLEEQSMMLVLSDELENIGSHNYIRATATLYDLESGQQFSVDALARESEARKGMDDSQITGATSSYARKYALNGLFAIDNTKDADTDEYWNKVEKATKEEQKTQEMLDAMKAEIDALATQAEITEYMKKNKGVECYAELRKYVQTIWENKK